MNSLISSSEQNEIDALAVLQPTRYTCMQNYILFDKLGSVELTAHTANVGWNTIRYYEATYEDSDITINADHVVKIVPSGNWAMDDRFLEEDSVKDIIRLLKLK